MTYESYRKEKEEGEAIFHGWGVDYEEFETGPGNFTVAILEFPDGSVRLLHPLLIRFLDAREKGVMRDE